MGERLRFVRTHAVRSDLVGMRRNALLHVNGRSRGVSQELRLVAGCNFAYITRRNGGAGMKEWGAWDWIAFSTVWIAALILAADAAIKGTDTLRSNLGWLVARPLWPFLPLLFLGIGTTVYLLRSFDILPATQSATTTFPKWPHPYRPIVIIGRTFRNEKVILDNYSYSNCVFENVTLQYDGTTAITLVNNTFSGSLQVISDNPAVDGAMVLTALFTKVPAGITVKLPSDSVFEPLTLPKQTLEKKDDNK
jgi:hypothetical protein